jgi:hypothetical protein
MLKKLMRLNMKIAGLRTCEIYDVMVTQSGGFDKLGFASRDMYNFFATFGPIPSHYSASTRASGERVLDPKVIVPKGAPSKKRMKPFHKTLRESRKRKQRSRRCSECGNLNHDIRKCPDLG